MTPDTGFALLPLTAAAIAGAPTSAEGRYIVVTAVEPKRGQSTRVTFTADKTGTLPIACAAHHPTIVAELIVAAKK